MVKFYPETRAVFEQHILLRTNSNTKSNANALLTWMKVVRFSGTIFVSLVNRSTMKKMNGFAAFVFGNRPNRSTKIDLRGFFTGNKIHRLFETNEVEKVAGAKKTLSDCGRDL